MGPFAYRSWVEISLQQIAENFQAVRAVVGPDVEVMPVVKADAYRHGAVEVSRRLTAEGARWLAVSNVEEGAILRDRGITARILVMADFLPAERAGLLDYNLTPVIHSLADIQEWDRLAAARGVTGRVSSENRQRHGTSRNARLGVRDSRKRSRPRRNTRIEGLMTHFASAANYASSQTEEQLATFNALCAELARAGLNPPLLHLSSSTPVAYGRRDAWQRMVRPGHAIYGYVSPVAKGTAPPRLLNVKPALTWKAAVLAVKDLPAGALVGYGAMFRAPQPMRIAVLAAGYADGIPHRLSNKGRVIAKGTVRAHDRRRVDGSHHYRRHALPVRSSRGRRDAARNRRRALDRRATDRAHRGYHLV